MVLFSQGREESLILEVAYFFENCIGMDDWQCRYIQDRCSYMCRIKESRKACTLWGIVGTRECIIL